MKATFSLVPFLFFALIAGCSDERRQTSTSTNDSSTDQNLDDYGRDPSHPYFRWTSIPEPFGDESSLEFKLTPVKIVGGQPVQIEVHAGSAYGPVTDTQVMVRTSSGSELSEFGYLSNPAEGQEWTEVAPEGTYVQVYQEHDDSWKEIRHEPSDSNYQNHSFEDSGHTRFVTSVTPTADKPIIELRWLTPSMAKDRYLKALADQAMQLYPRIE